ncbi:hypothetical protein P3T76_014648 [Phytophthora citrophthora]|uniref:PX domain-containing protein n=1 Tax=Phytophthora citrophthora TaxID=4793 RepID=A0AAD9G1L5_9STRA|nr:hypothetical protein P3T76_014648 [Phytophthora citrophthora]
MGCSQSKANDVVIEPITAPPSECGKPSMELAFTEIIVENEETSTSVPPAPVEEEAEEEQEKEVVTKEEPAEQQVEVPVAVEEPVTVEEPVPVEEPVAVEASASAGALQPVVEEEDPAVEQEEEHPMEPEVEAEEQVEVQEEKSSVVEKSAATSVSAPVWTFVADKVSFTIGVAFFEILGSNTDGDEVHLTKRYSEFKVLHADMAKFMTKEELPSMPGTSFLQGRNDKALLQERETVFVEMLNAIAQHPEASQSAPFTAFLA